MRVQDGNTLLGQLSTAAAAAIGDYLEYNSTTRLSLMSWANSERSGAPLNVPDIFLTSTSTQEGKPTFSASCSASWIRSWPLAFSVTPTTSEDLTSADGTLSTLPLTVIEPCVTSWRASARVEPSPILYTTLSRRDSRSCSRFVPVEPLRRAASPKYRRNCRSMMP